MPSRSSTPRTAPRPIALGLVVGMTVLAPLPGLGFVLGGGYHDTQRWMELVVFAGIAVLAWARLAHGRLACPPGRGWEARSLVLAGLLGLASAGVAALPAHAFFEWGVFFFLLLAAWLMACEVAQGQGDLLERVLSWVVAGSLLYGFKALVAYGAALLSGAQPDPSNLIPGFDTFRFFNHGQTITLPLIALLICLKQAPDTHSRRWRGAGWVALAMWWMLLLVSSGRGTWAGLLLAVAAVGLSRRGRAWPWVRTMAWGGVAGLVAYGLLYVALPQWLGLEPFGHAGKVVQRSVENFGSSRGALWHCALQMVVQHPWLGAGPLHYAQVCAPLGIAAHPHNWVLQVAAEWGLLALGCMCAVLAGAWRSLHACEAVLAGDDGRGQAVLTCWLATGYAIALDGLVSGLVVMPVSQLWIAVYAGLAWGWVRALRAPARPAGPDAPARRWVAGGSILAAAGLLAVGVMATLASAHSDESARLRLAPRAWGAGFFGVAPP